MGPTLRPHRRMDTGAQPDSAPGPGRGVRVDDVHACGGREERHARAMKGAAPPGSCLDNGDVLQPPCRALIAGVNNDRRQTLCHVRFLPVVFHVCRVRVRQRS